MPQRILYIQRPAGGGSSRSLYELVRGLDRSQFEPVVLFFQDNILREKIEALGIRTITLDWVGRRLQQRKLLAKADSRSQKILNFITYEIPLVFEIIRILKIEKIDLIHQNLGFERAAIIAAKILGLPQVCHFRHFSKIPKTKKWLASSVDAGIFISNAIQKFYLEQSIPFRRSQVIYNPIDIDSFINTKGKLEIRKQFSISGSDMVISNIGRITPWKGQDYFLNAVEKIMEEYPTTKVLIVGEAGLNKKDQEYLVTLKNKVKNSLLNNRVIFTGERGDIAEIMSASDIVVHSASEPEPFGRVIVEAMASGTPVIATNAGGVMEIIEDGVTGLLVPVKNDSLMERAIVKLLKSRTFSNSLAVKGQQEVSERFQISNHVSKIQEIYCSVLSSKSRNLRRQN